MKIKMISLSEFPVDVANFLLLCHRGASRSDPADFISRRLWDNSTDVRLAARLQLRLVAKAFCQQLAEFYRIDIILQISYLRLPQKCLVRHSLFGFVQYTFD